MNWAEPQLVPFTPTFDSRGSLTEVYRRDGDDFPPYNFVQEVQTHSYGNVLRGLHYQNRKPAGKLFRVVRGMVRVVAVDLHQGNVTFGRAWAATLNDGGIARYGFWSPPGFAFGFYSITESDVCYQATSTYDPDCQQVLSYLDPDLNIHWGMVARPKTSPKDADGRTLRALADAGLVFA